MDSPIICIPANFTDAGRLLGLFEVRSAVEAITFSAPVLLAVFRLMPGGLTLKIIVASVFLAPVWGFSLTGILDYSLLDFLRVYFRWRRKRRVLGEPEGGDSD